MQPKKLNKRRIVQIQKKYLYLLRVNLEVLRVCDAILNYGFPSISPISQLSENLLRESSHQKLNQNYNNERPFSLGLDFVDLINASIEAFGNYSNQSLFRNFYIDGRKITSINPSLDDSHKLFLKRNFLHISNYLYEAYDKLFLANEDFSNSVVGFRRKVSYMSHAKAHLDSGAIINSDISKFYNSITLSKVINNNLYFNSIKSIFALDSGWDYDPDLLRPDVAESFDTILGACNLSFIAIFNFLSHNGVLPTGASYSPTISNMLMANIDLSIIRSLNESEIYTRYADDLCISTKAPYDENGNFTLTLEKIKSIEEDINLAGFFLKYDKTVIMGPKDKKVIAGLTIDQSDKNNPKLSIGSDRKISLRNLFFGRPWSSISESERGTLEWIKSVNIDQYNFITRSMLDDRQYRRPKFRAKPDYVSNTAYDLLNRPARGDTYVNDTVFYNQEYPLTNEDDLILPF